MEKKVKMNYRYVKGEHIEVKVYTADLSIFKWEEAVFMSCDVFNRVDVRMTNGIVKKVDRCDIKKISQTKCIHCGRKFKKQEIKSSIIIPCENREITDFFCPWCNKVLNGYTEIKEVI